MTFTISRRIASSAQRENPQSKAGFHRSMGLVANFSLGFTYLSTLFAIYALFAFALTLAGPASIWWILIIACGQMLVAFTFGEVASQYPITGGLYPWCRRLWGTKYAWLAAWIYLWAIVVTVTSVAEYSMTFAANLFEYQLTPQTGFYAATGLLVLAFFMNISGTKTLATIARLGFWCEIVGVIALGLYLLIFERVNDFSVLFDNMGVVAKDGTHFTAFLGAALIGLFMFFGFEACGNVAEEVKNASREIPIAMILSIVFGAISAIISFAGYLLAAPNLPDIVSGKLTDPIPLILNECLGSTGAKAFLVVAIIAFISCVLSLQAALSRLVFSFARDNMLPGSKWLSALSPKGAVPNNAMMVSCVAPILICYWVYLQPENLNRITAFAIIGIYISFQMVVLAALRNRLRGWKPAGEWTMGRYGILVNVLALAYGVAAIILLGAPADASLQFLDRWIVLFGLAMVLGLGLLYMVLAKPYGRSSAPADDALEFAAALRTKQLRK